MEPTWESDCGTVKLWLGDCIEVMATWPDGAVDSVVTDPPYGASDTHSGHLSKVVLRDGEPAGQQLGFDGITLDEMVGLTHIWCQKANRWVVFTCEWKYAHALPNLVRFGVWRKPDGAPQFTGDRPGMGWECVAICHRRGRKRWNGGGKHAFWTYPKGSNQTGHPTGKPLGLLLDFVLDFTEQSETIADPFMGSGTTGLAAVRLGRQFWGIEIDPEYFEIAKRRIKDELNKVAFLQPEEKKKEQGGLF